MGEKAVIYDITCMTNVLHKTKRGALGGIDSRVSDIDVSVYSKGSNQFLDSRSI